MCLAIPGKVLEIDKNTQPTMGKVSFGGIQKRICIEWVPDVNVGDYVLVHVGFAISKMDEKEALETLKLLEAMGDLSTELEVPDDGRAVNNMTSDPSPSTKRPSP
jgi:hydrogenase expression/formation protein HypC